MSNNNVTCKVWATEVAADGFKHRCHAGFRRFRGGVHFKDNIDQDLQTTPTLGKDATWELLTCEPNNHNGSECNDCPYDGFKGFSDCYGTEEQALYISPQPTSHL